ncbi:MAG: Lon-like protease [Microbacteriaceae bacterium]|nr:Lon-like protease [Microbacteriaceae bacterium]
MTRRIAVLTTGAVLLVVFGLLGTLLPVPYVAQVPGPTFNTLGDIDGSPIITVTGKSKNPVRGNLNLTTVGISQSGLSLVEAVKGWFDPEISVVPEEAVYPPDQSPDKTREANRQAFLTSEQSAESAALGHLGYPKKVVVQEVTTGAAATGKLQTGDAIVALDGRPMPTADSLTTALAAIPGGTPVSVGYLRLGKPGTATVTTKAATGKRTGSLLGVAVRDAPYAPFLVDIHVADVGGPSAGLMLTLGVLDLVGTTDLTHGKVIAGTGTIGADGKVGPIGGIPLKMVAARKLGAVLFLVPADNCAEAKASPAPGFPLAKVVTLDDALKALSDFEAGRTPAAC